MNHSLLSLLTLPLLTLTFACQSMAAQELPKPGPQHAKLAKSAGTWDTTAESIGPDGKPLVEKGVSVKKVGLGGFWLIDDFKSTWNGIPFQGHGMTGYDPFKKKYVGTWTDSMSPSVMLMEGDFDKTGKILTLTGMGVGMDGNPAKYRLVMNHQDDNTIIFEMYMTMKGMQEMKSITITYKRRVAKADKEAPAKK